MNLTVKNLYKSYGQNHVLRDFGAEFAQGQITCIMGPSGIGKTTLLRILLGLEKADRGEISDTLSAWSCVFPEDRLLAHLDALQNLSVVCNVDPKILHPQLSAVGLAGEAIRIPVLQLSSGMRRRVAIVRAMAAHSERIAMDEPFKGLDTETKKIAISYILSHTRGRTTIVVTHDEEDIPLLGARLIRMA